MLIDYTTWAGSIDLLLGKVWKRLVTLSEGTLPTLARAIGFLQFQHSVYRSVLPRLFPMC